MNKKIKNLMGLVVFFFLVIFLINSASAYEGIYDGTKSFKEDKKLTSVIVKSGVVNIPEEAFIGCESLTSVTIPRRFANRITEIFSHCMIFEINFIDDLKDNLDPRPSKKPRLELDDIIMD